MYQLDFREYICAVYRSFSSALNCVPVLEEVDREHDVGRRPMRAARGLLVLLPPRRLQRHHAGDRVHPLRDPEAGALVAAHEDFQAPVLAKEDQGGLGLLLLRLLEVLVVVNSIEPPHQKFR